MTHGTDQAGRLRSPCPVSNCFPRAYMARRSKYALFKVENNPAKDQHNRLGNAERLLYSLLQNRPRANYCL